MYIELAEAIEWTIRILSICILIDTVEKAWNYQEFRDGGIFDWKWIRQYPGISTRRRIVRVLADLVFGFRVWFLLVAVRGIAAAGLILWPAELDLRMFALSIFFVVGSLENFRRMPFQPEAPNRFTLTVAGALLLQTLVPTSVVSLACLWFIALQACLSYTTAGFAKVLNNEWRAGRGIQNALNSPQFVPSPTLAAFVSRFKFAGGAINYSTIGFEIFFPLVLIVGAPWFWFFLVCGVLMHLVNVFVLRLNNYFWAWIATYPAILYIAQG